MVSGQRIRDIRKAQGLSIVKLAKEAGIHPSTLWRWERERNLTETAHPTALKGLLRVLGIGQSETINIVATCRHHPGYQQLLPEVRLPCSGDLWGALRRRKGVGLRELAKVIGANPGDVSHWEAGKRLPKQEYLGPLFEVLTPSLEEQEILSSCTFGLEITRFSDLSMDELSATLEALHEPIWKGDPAFAGELILLALQEEATRRLSTHPHAQRLLAEAFHARGLFLSLREHLREAAPCLRSAMALVTAKEHPIAWFGALSHYARVQPSIKSDLAIQTCHDAIPLARDRNDPALESLLLRELATYQMAVRTQGSALVNARKAEVSAQRSERLGYIRNSRMVLASILAEMGYAKEALKTMPEPPTHFECEEDALGAINRLIYWVRLCWWNGDRLNSLDFLRRVYELIEYSHLTQFEEAAHKLERAINC
ncbi:helix-turn-helix transcriptional regulator [Armatimonas sp.]|uniref:helix-turn-helix domain-containing protein n=1 Tax=Armatimonas sp. TaxID=1872638 RepID=UPI00286B948A|nr:helix-turn-helix transcriptional regulator [Armatimonas sp.]